MLHISHYEHAWRVRQEIGTYTMTCVGYDADFIRVLARNAPAWASHKEQQASRATSRGKQARKKGTGSKRKPIHVDSGTESHPDDEVEKLAEPQEPVVERRRSGREHVKRVRIS